MAAGRAAPTAEERARALAPDVGRGPPQRPAWRPRRRARRRASRSAYLARAAEHRRRARLGALRADGGGRRRPPRRAARRPDAAAGRRRPRRADPAGPIWRGLPWGALRRVEHLPRAVCATAAWCWCPRNPSGCSASSTRARRSPGWPDAVRRPVRRPALAGDARGRHRRRPRRPATLAEVDGEHRGVARRSSRRAPVEDADARRDAPTRLDEHARRARRWTDPRPGLAPASAWSRPGCGASRRDAADGRPRPSRRRRRELDAEPAAAPRRRSPQRGDAGPVAEADAPAPRRGRSAARAARPSCVDPVERQTWSDRVAPDRHPGDAVEPWSSTTSARAGRRPGHRPGARRRPHPARAHRRPARRAHPHPAARHRVDRGRRLRAVRRRLLRPRPPPHPGARPRRRRGAAAGVPTTSGTPTRPSTRAGSSRPSSPPAARVDPRHPRRPELVGPGRRGHGAGAGLVDRPAGHGRPGRRCASDRVVLNGSAGPDQQRRPSPRPCPVTLITAAGGGARVVVRDGGGRSSSTGPRLRRDPRPSRVSPPVRVQSTDGSVEVTVDGEDHGALGATGSHRLRTPSSSG